MQLNELTDLYSLISGGIENVSSRKQSMKFRKLRLFSTLSNNGFTKIAFDTRRINQETEYNPRRGLQHYNRSQSFLSETLSQKINNFSKLRDVLLDLRATFGKKHQWQDSNARVLLNTLDSGLRTIARDGDFVESQPGTGSFDYIEELLHMRYRLGFDELSTLAENDLKKIILSKDEELIYKNSNQNTEITKSDVATKGYDSLIEKLLNGCKASIDNPDVERTITITIRDRFNKEI